MLEGNTALQEKPPMKMRIFKHSKKSLSKEDSEIVFTLEKLRSDLESLHSRLNFVTDPVLIDSCIYEILSIHMRYAYYLNLCKEKGLVAEWF